MIPYHCIVKHDPPDTYGDCLRAAIASILDCERIEDVPHFLRDGDDERAQVELREWLISRGVRPFLTGLHGTVTLDEIFTTMVNNNPDIDYLLFCQCGSGDHVVVCRNDQVTHNPAWDNAAVIGPKSDGYWIVMVMVRI